MKGLQFTFPCTTCVIKVSNENQARPPSLPPSARIDDESESRCEGGRSRDLLNPRSSPLRKPGSVITCSEYNTPNRCSCYLGEMLAALFLDMLRIRLMRVLTLVDTLGRIVKEESPEPLLIRKTWGLLIQIPLKLPARKELCFLKPAALL